jgi:short subunit fatty acids transporter
MNNRKNLLTILIVVILVVLAYGVLTMPDRRTTTEKIGDAIHELPQGADKAARQLEDRTPGQKMGDAVKDAGDKIKDNTRSN